MYYILKLQFYNKLIIQQCNFNMSEQKNFHYEIFNQLRKSTRITPIEVQEIERIFLIYYFKYLFIIFCYIFYYIIISCNL